MRVVTSLLLQSLAVAASLPKFKHLVTFGDSYTDTESVWDGGVPWPVYLAGYADLTLHPFARAGGTCSDKVTTLGYPSVMESQIPDFESAKLQLPQDKTVYTLWIGTNDVGPGALLTGNFSGKTVVDTTKCAVDWVRVMYDLGARYFVFQNMIPLELSPAYAVDAYPSVIWHTERNTTAFHLGMLELTSAGNAISELLLRDLAPTLPGAHIAYFNSHGLFADMCHNPSRYLNGTAPLNVTGAANACVYELDGGPVGGACPPPVSGSDRDSYLWWDELHPGEQADRVVAREIAKALAQGDTQWAEWIS
ncbi:SGNH hydrolase [Auricularia subglabra TFB-10046 SS5]|uniref:SGNH hydrolase n=1 Tax=Auricularia subglabra (strain TFB-10046 / SS5) TaxID=717982 RepID=J0WUL5_AURST|nr:SGNH hydrolase [Auricularia subglabra TFB-10046 SS5]